MSSYQVGKGNLLQNISGGKLMLQECKKREKEKTWKTYTKRMYITQVGKERRKDFLPGRKIKLTKENREENLHTQNVHNIGRKGIQMFLLGRKMKLTTVKRTEGKTYTHKTYTTQVQERKGIQDILPGRKIKLTKENRGKNLLSRNAVKKKQIKLSAENLQRRKSR